MLVLLAIGTALGSAGGLTSVPQEKPSPNVAGEERPKSLLEKDLDKLKVIYAFAEWGGKTKMEGLVAALNFDAKTFGDLGVVETIHKTASLFQIVIRLDAITPRLEVTVIRAESALAVHENIMAEFSLNSRPPPAFKRPAGGELSQVGDVCFVPSAEWTPKDFDKAVLPRVYFARNNVYVKVDQLEDGKKTYWDLAAIAKRIDKQIIEWLPKPRVEKPATKAKAEPNDGGKAEPASQTGAAPKPSPTGGSTEKVGGEK